MSVDLPVRCRPGDKYCFTVSELSKLTGIDESDLYRMVREGLIVKVPHLGKSRIRIADNEAARVFNPPSVDSDPTPPHGIDRPDLSAVS